MSADFDFAVALRHQKPRQRFRLGDRRRQSDAAHLGRQLPQPRQAERQQIAALGGDQRMQFVEHDALQRAEQERRIVGGQQQRQLFGRGQQNIRRIAPLPLPARHRRVAGAGLDLDRQPHLGDRRLQIARDIDRERLQRRDVEGVQAAGALDAAAGGDDGVSRLASLAAKAWRTSRGWGASANSSQLAPPPPTSPPLREAAEKTVPPASAKIPPASCRRRSARSAAPSDRPALSPAVPTDVHAATSRATRTIEGSGRAAARPARPIGRVRIGAAQNKN